MKENFLTKMFGAIDKNLPAILTWTGVGVGLLTIGYSVYAGFRIAKTVQDETKSKEEKVKEVAKAAAPVVIGAVVTTTCNIAAHKEHTSRYAALGMAVAASKVDTDAIKNEVKDICGLKTEKDEKKDVKPELVIPQNETIRIHDLVTGHYLETDILTFWNKVNEWNAIGETETWSIDQFYEDLEGNRYKYYAQMYDSIIFGGDESDVASFRPEFGCELDVHAKPVYTIEYPHGTR